MAINAQKFLPAGKQGGALAKVSQTIKKNSVIITLSESSIKNVGIIKTKVIDIENIMRGTLASQKKQLDAKKRSESSARREKLESDLEAKPKVDKDKVNMPKVPRMGFLDWIKNFIGKTILGYFAVRMIDHLPKLMPFIKVIGGAADFIINVGGKLLDGLVTFIDWGYKAYDATRGFVKNLFGNDGVKQFEQLSGILNKFLNLVIIAGMIAAGSGGVRGGPGPGGRILGRGVSRSLTRLGLKTVGKNATKTILQTVRPLVRNAPLIGGLLEFGISWALGDPLPKAAFRGVGSFLLGAVGTAIGGPIGLAVGGFAGGEIGGVLYDMFFGNKKPQPLTEQTQASAGGGVTRGGRAQGGVRRSIGGTDKKQKYKRALTRKPGKVEITSPGSDTGEKEKVFDLFGFIKGAVDKINPFNTIKKTGEELGKTDYFGPILAITSKVIAGQKPSASDYKNVGIGINLLIAKGIQDQQLKGGIVAAFAEGGMVDPDVLAAAETGGDISNWVARTFQTGIESKVEKNLRMIREDAEKKASEQQGQKPEQGTAGGTAGQFSPEGLQGEIYKYLLSKGMTDNHALGIMANIHRESGFRPGVSEYGGPGVGLFQYSSGGRKSAFLKAVPDYATNWKGQIDFAIKEDVGPQYFKQNFSSPQDAADWWMRNWERPAEYIQNDKGPKIHAQYLAGLQKYKTNKGYEIPTGSTSVATAGVTGSLSERQRNAGELGSFIKSLGVARGSGVHEHPQHGGIKHQHRGRGHYEGRAIDIGGWGGRYGKANLGRNFVDDQSAILAGINQFAAKTGKRPSLVLHGDNDPSHWDHVHAEYERGGETLGRPHLAMLGEKGKEIVVDADSAGPAKDMLLAINQATGYKGVMDAIRQYAPYDALGAQTIIMPEIGDGGGYGGGGDQSAVAMSISGGESSNPMDILYKGG